MNCLAFFVSFFQEFPNLMLVGVYEPNIVGEVDVLEKLSSNLDPILIYQSKFVVWK